MAQTLCSPSSIRRKYNAHRTSDAAQRLWPHVITCSCVFHIFLLLRHFVVTVVAVVTVPFWLLLSLQNVYGRNPSQILVEPHYDEWPLLFAISGRTGFHIPGWVIFLVVFVFLKLHKTSYTLYYSISVVYKWAEVFVGFKWISHSVFRRSRIQCPVFRLLFTSLKHISFAFKKRKHAKTQTDTHIHIHTERERYNRNHTFSTILILQYE